jgi:addiction module RelE/StbE family toxin
MVEIRFTASFHADLDDIAFYISKESPRYATRFVEMVYESVEKLLTFPRLGRIVPELEQENIRELILGNYRIVYKLNSDNELFVIRIIHSSRLFGTGM